MKIKVYKVRDEATTDHLGYEIEIDNDKFFKLNPTLNLLSELKNGHIVPAFGQRVVRTLILKDEA